MKFLLIAVSLALFPSSFIIGQCFEVTYHAHHNLKKPDSQNGRNTLTIDVPNQRSIYVHDEFPTTTKYLKTGGGSTVTIDGDSEKLPIYLDITKDIMVYKSEYATRDKNFIFTDSIPHIEWSLMEESKIINNITLKKAIAHYGGRNYIAWYNPEISLGFGPHRFTGLPGLIHDIYSEDGLVSFKLVSARELDDCSKVNPPSDGIQMDSITYLKYMTRRLESAESFGATNNDPPADWEIEKNRHIMNHIIKKKRGY